MTTQNPSRAFPGTAQRFGLSRKDPDAIFIGLVDMIVGRASEILRTTGDRIDALSEAIFERASRRGRPVTDEYQSALATLGQEGSRISKVRESLVSIELMLRFASPPAPGSCRRRANLKAISARCCATSPRSRRKPNISLGKVQFLLDTILGLVNLNQNDIIKILSVIMVVFTPPTFFASMYGMNFKNMPEYDWAYGYQYGLVLMLVSAVLPYLVFRWKKWL